MQGDPQKKKKKEFLKCILPTLQNSDLEEVNILPFLETMDRWFQQDQVISHTAWQSLKALRELCNRVSLRFGNVTRAP